MAGDPNKFEWDDEEVETVETQEENAEGAETGKTKTTPAENEVPEFDWEKEEEETEEEEGEEKPKDPPASGEESEEGEEDDISSLPGTVKVILEDLVTVGFATADEIKDVTADTLYTFLEKVAENRAEAVIEESVAGLSERERVAAEFLLSGGKLEDLVKNTVQKSYDVTTENGALEFLRDHYTSQGLGTDEIQDQIDYHESQGNAIKIAEKYHARWKASKEQEVSSSLKAPKDSADEQRKQNEAWRTKVVQGINKVGEYAGVDFSTQRKELINDIIVNSIKLPDGRYTSRFIDAFNKVYADDPQKLLLIATILRDDFNPEKLAAKIETKETTKLKAKIKAAGSQNTKPKGTAPRSFLDALEKK